MRAARELARANPMRVVARAPLRRYWGDLHGQSGETVGTNPARSYFAYARDKAFVDIVGHQGNDFQITDAFWQELNRLTAEFDVPGRFVCVPGYEWSGNTGMGGDRNIFYRREGRPIFRSSRILVDGQDPRQRRLLHRAGPVRRAARARMRSSIAHVGGRYADIKMAHDGRLERAVEVHSTWGTFEWLLHDAFDQGYRVGVVCHSDDHKGRPGATRPGASTFGAIGGLTCYLMPELTRDALFAALRARRHYGTTGTRLCIDLARPVRRAGDALLRRSAARSRAAGAATREALMGDIIRPGAVPMRLAAEVIGTAPIERVDVLHGAHVVQTVRPYAAADLGAARARAVAGRGISRARARDQLAGKADAQRQSHRALRAGQFPQSRAAGDARRRRQRARVEFGDHRQHGGHRSLARRRRAAARCAIESNIVSGEVDLATLDGDAVAFDGGGLGRTLSVYRLPEADWSRRVALEHQVTFPGGADLPVYLRVTQADGHQAWSSPIYLIA